MKALRKLLCSTFAGLMLLTSLGAAEATANPGHSGSHHGHDRHERDHHQDRHHRVHTVYMRHCSDDPWTAYGSYRSDAEARRVARNLAGQGYQTFVR